MKNITYTGAKGIAFMIMQLFVFTASTAQFRQASLLQNTVPVTPVTSANTGNDILDYSGNTYEVSVWDDVSGSNSGMYWKRGSVSGFLFLNPSAGVKDPDVALVTNNAGTVFAVVAYYAQNTQEFMYERFQWMSGTNTFSSIGATPIKPGLFEKTINIDANSLGEFAIVWDEQGLIINCVTGFTPTGGVPDLYAGGAILQLESGNYPDVSMINLPSGENQIDVVYINQQQKVSVDFYRMDDLSNGVVALTNGFRSPGPDLVYRYPRIATPNSLAGVATDFSVVVEDTDLGSSWYIKGFTNNACCNPNMNFTIFNDGSTSNSPFNLTDYPNTKPVVSYDRSYTNIWVGWNFDNSMGMLPAPGALARNTPIAVYTNKNGLVQPAQNYLYVANTVGSSDAVKNISISGRNSTLNHFTYNNTNNNTVYTKTAPQQPAPINLRTGSSAMSPDAFLAESMYSNTTQQPFKMLSFDLSGRLISENTGTAAELLAYFESQQKKSLPSFTIIKIQDKAGNTLYTGKTISVTE